ncbi:Alpha-1,3-arabinosyltransferase XAT2 [Camellia lanceoleosa]|uniref:Alpha-1,3-arabinosyltransferase XAT2 n=1 Tax=Camellia lanceoleosa TaxID=1840588 RepID=A0ACC0G1S6_9ERIC|nr:Alpha-1,3-arabinosyltransferase XAT2 [Camellia lanceoleosa]
MRMVVLQRVKQYYKEDPTLFNLYPIFSHFNTLDPSSAAGPHYASPSNSHWSSPISCDRSHANYDLCSINGPTVLDPTVSTFYVVGPTTSTLIVEKVRPYPQKNSSQTMDRIKEITLTSGPPSPQCMIQHNARALVFSVGGYTWNFFHTFIDGFIPLFITINSMSTDQDLVLVITNSEDWWVRKYTDLFHSFSKHPIIILDNDTSTHCFPSATVGLISHGFMTIDPKQLPNSKNILQFHAILEQTYCHDRLALKTQSRPRLILVTRTGGVGRVIMNQDDMKRVAEEEGFDVVEFEPEHETPLREACELVSSSHAMVGVHGAALTYGLFLRPGSVLMQVVGLGLDNVAELCFGSCYRDMKLEYMEYKIGVEESSLVDRYGKDDVIVKDSKALQVEWYDAIMEVYLRQQNVKLDMVRFREYLKKAYKKAKILMHNEG